MHERVKSRGSLSENVLIWIAAFVCFGAVVLIDRMGMPQKWHAAVVGTAGPFIIVILAYRRKWPFPTFWTALGICFAVHVLAIWLVFQRLLAPIQTLGILIWSPIAFGEGVLLLGIVPMIEQRLHAKRRRT